MIGALPFGAGYPGQGPLVVVASGQVLVPISDVAAGAWTPTPASPTTLYDKLDEASADDADYISTAALVAAETPVTLGIQAGSAPASAGTSVSVRAALLSASYGSATLRSELLQGTTVIATWTDTVSSTTPATLTHTLTSGEEATITDYTTLRVRVTLVAG